MVVRSSYLHNEIFHIGKTVSLYWIGAQVVVGSEQVMPLARIVHGLNTELVTRTTYWLVDSRNLAWRKTPETGSGVVEFADLAAQVKMQNIL